jgi:hypothetical protein
MIIDKIRTDLIADQGANERNAPNIRWLTVKLSYSAQSCNIK